MRSDFSTFIDTLASKFASQSGRLERTCTAFPRESPRIPSRPHPRNEAVLDDLVHHSIIQLDALPFPLLPALAGLRGTLEPPASLIVV